MHTLLEQRHRNRITQLALKQENLDATPAINITGKGNSSALLNVDVKIRNQIMAVEMQTFLEWKATGISRQDFHGLMRTGS